MALAPITTPDVQQSSAPIGPGPIPGAFGASVLGAGLENAGKTAESVSTELGATAVHLQTLYNDAEIANRTMDVYDKGSQLGSKFHELKMNAAVQAYPAFRQNIEDLISKGGEGLAPAALPQYMQQTRRFLMGELNSAATHTAQQGNAYTTQTTTALATTAGQAYVSNPTPETLDTFNHTLGKYIALTASQTGLDPFKEGDSALLRQDSLKITSPVFYSVASTLINKGGDLTNAASYLAAHRQDMEPERIRELDNAMALRTNANNVYSSADLARHGGAFGAVPDFNQFWKTFEIPHEGSALVKDSNGADVKFGINAAHNPGVNVPTLTADQAGEIFKRDYTKNGLSAGLAYAHADTAFMAGSTQAQELLDKSGGDVNKFLELRTQFLNGLVAKDPAKYGKYAEAWSARTRDLQTYIGGLPSGPAGILHGLPPPKPTDDPDQYEATMSRTVAANLAIMYPKDTQEREKAQAVADAETRREVAPLREQAKATLNALTADAIQNGYQSFEQLQAAHPSEIARLPGSYQKTLMGSVGSIGNQPTTQRLENERQLVGRMAQLGDNPNAMDKVNLDVVDLTNEARKRLGDQLAKYQNGTWKPDSTADHIVTSPFGKQALDAIYQFDFKGVGRGTPAEAKAGEDYEAHKNRFIGALADQVTTWRGKHEGKEPQDSDIAEMVANVSANMVSGTPNIFGGGTKQIPGFAVRPEDLAEVDRTLAANHWAITDYNRGRAYDMMRRAGRIK